MAIRYQDENGNWVTGQKAIETKITDQQGNFESDTVEGALRELAEGVKANADVTKLEATIQANSSKIGSLQTKVTNIQTNVTNLQSDMATAQEDIEWLKVNGGGGGGTAVPTITSTFKDTAIDKGSDVTIPIFFSSPNQGAGTAYILVNNIQVDTTGISQGNNNVRIQGQFLTSQTENLVAIYAKDRAGIVSNQLSWTIVAGGIELTSTFDYETDYGITDTIRIDYNIDTGIRDTITLTLDIDNNVTTYTAVNGGNFIDIIAADLGLGTHAVKMYATVGKYTSRTLSFNLVIVSTTELYLSSSFDQTKEYTYGVPISVNYRLSKQSTEEFNVYLKIDGETVKTQKLTVGSYYWTIQSLSEGNHTLTIQAISQDYSEDKSLTLTVNVVMGEYTPVEDYTSGLICDLNAMGKSNDDDEVLVDNIWRDESGNGHDAKLVNFNYGTNGFVNDTLVCDNDAYAVIEWSPWERNAITGSTIDIIYEPINSGIEDCRVLDYTQITDDSSTAEIKPFKGVYADILHGIVSSASSGTSAGKINIDDESGEVHLTWVLDRTNKFMKTYINGVLSRIMFLSDSGSGVNKVYEDFSLNSNIYLNSTKGENCGTNNIKRFRVYDHALTSDQVLQNHLANITDLTKQEEEYNFNYNNTTLPKMYLTGDTTNMTASQTVPMKIEYVSPNEEKYGQSFNTGIQNNPVRIQGTSSLQYVRHNYTIFLKDEYGADMLYNPYGSGSKPENVFCLKADYVESSHANNTGMAKFINDCVYDTKTPMQLADSDCRTTINGFPIEVYMNGEYLGVYNFNHDRYSYRSYGYDYNKYPNMLVYEINSNSNTSAGAFYRYGDNAESSANVSELEYYKRDFNLIYGNRTADSDTYSEIKTLVEWVSVAEQDLFREMISEHFNKEYLFRYFLTVLMIGAVDSLGKNMKIMTVDGKVWYPTFYDLDTVLGIDNSGYLTIEPDVEIESGSYNTSNSNLWSKVWNFFNAELKAEWAKMRQGSFTLDNLMNYIYGEQISKIPAKLYNDDAQVKYLEFGSLYTYCCHGSKEHQIKRWLRERIAYVDSMLGYFTSQEDQVTIRMNKTGEVSFEVTPYIPLYFSVKWSNATGGTQTFKLKRGETKRFYYTSTTSTDQEVIIYHAKYIKRLDNLSNLNPSSCILSNAVKLTNVEIHSNELYNINVTNNKFLRSINLENCTALGTVTATGSSLNLSNCKYLRYCNVYNTNLTEVQLNTSGGSLTEIYYPKSIQSINLIKQRLLELVGLPYGVGGSEVPTSLYTISIQECPSIKKLNTSSNEAIASSFASMVYVNNLTIRNSLDLASLNFDGFHRLQNVIIENMYNLEEIGFNNLLPVGETSTIKYIGMSNCPKLGTIELNCTSNDYEITFADDAILNFGGLFMLKSITSNCVLKGIKTIVVPINLESMFFTNEYGSGYSTIENIWVSSQCTVDTQATTPIITHVDSTYTGIDFLGMHLKNIDLGALVNIPKAINFSLSPTTVNPHFNLNRDGETYRYLQPVGTLDLSNYTESLARFFDGVDLDKLEIICTKNLPQTDLSYCFYNSTFSTNDAINKLLTKVSSITNLDYCFYRTTINSTDILDEINMGASSSMNYTFAECPNIKTLNNVVIPSTVTSVEGMFNKCPLTTITNMIVNVQGSIRGLFKGCNKLTTINTLRIPNVTDVSGTFDGCTSLSSLGGFELPSSCTNVSNLFNGCYMLTELGMEFGANITAGDNWYPPNLETLHDTIISNDHVKLTNCTTLKTLNGVNISGGDLSDLFNGCINLANINNCTFNATTSLARAFKGCAKITINPITTIVDTITDISEMYSGCTGITDISGMTFGSGITNATDWLPPNLTTANNVTIKNNNVKFTDCTSLTSCTNLTIAEGVTDTTEMFQGCGNLESVTGLTIRRAINMSQMFRLCTNLKSISFVIPDSCTDIYGLFAGCTNLIDISGMVFGSGITNTGNWAYNVPITTANNITIKNNVVNFYDMRRLKECKNLSRPNSTDWTSFFEGCTSLLEDIIFPQNTTNVTNCFKGCTGMTSIHANWNNEYTNDITTTDCYSGCTGIETIDGQSVVLFPGDNSLDYIPKEWGGYGLVGEYTSVIEMNIPSDNYELSLFDSGRGFIYSSSKDLNYYSENNSIAWGDGSYLTKSDILNDPNYDSAKGGIPKKLAFPTHTYAKAGTYYIKGNFTSGGYGYSGSAREYIIKCLNLAYKGDTGQYLTSYNGEFNYCINLTYVNLTSIKNNPLKNVGMLFNHCSSLTLDNIVGLNELNLSNVTNLSSMFNGCTNITQLPFTTIPDNVTNIDNIFSNTGITDISGLIIGSGVTSATDWITNCPITTANNVTIKNNVVKFTGCTTLTTCTNLNVSSISDISNFFSNCSSLTADIVIPSHITNCTNCFKGCTSMTNIHSNWNNSYTNGITSTDCYSGCTGITHIDNENVITYEGDSGLDYIPKEWGGYGFDEEFTSVVEIVTTEANQSFEMGYFNNFVYKNNDVFANTKNAISWGDGTYYGSSDITNASNYDSGNGGIHGGQSIPAHTYTTPGTYYVKGNFKFGDGITKPETFTSAVTRVLKVARKVEFYSTTNGNKRVSAITNFGMGFTNLSNCTYINVSNLVTNSCTNLGSMFKGCSSLTTLDLSSWNTSNVTNMQELFYNCAKLQTITGLENWNTSKLGSMFSIFENCTSLSSFPAIENWDLSNCAQFDELFRNVGCTGTFRPNWNLANVWNGGTRGITYMFGNLNGSGDVIIDLSNCIVPKNHPVITSSGYMFGYSKSLTQVILPNNLKVKYLTGWFNGCTNLTTIDISGLDLSECTEANNTFASCNSLTDLRCNETAKDIKVNIDLGWSTKLTVASLMSVINSLATVSTTYTLKIDSTNKAKLSAAQIRIATNKGWTVV